MMIELKSVTKYFAKRRLIRAAIEHFIANPTDETVDIISYFEHGLDRGVYKITVNKKRLIRFTFNFMTKKHQWKLFDPERWTKATIQKVYMNLMQKQEHL